MFRGPGAHENRPDVTLFSQSLTQGQAHPTRAREAKHDREKPRNDRQTFGAQDEVVNVGPRGHAGALAALLDHTPRGHHLHMDHLRRRAAQNSVEGLSNTQWGHNVTLGPSGRTTLIQLFV